MRKKWGRRKSVFITLFISYIIILLFPMIISGAFYTKVESILIENANKNNAAILEQATRIIDTRMIEIEQLTSQIAMHPKLPLLLDQRMVGEGQNLYSSVEFMNEMSRYSAVSSFIEDFYIYFSESDVILSRTMKTDSKTFYNDIYQYRNLSYEDYVNRILSPYHHQTYFPSEDIRSGNRQYKMISHVNSLPLGQKNDLKGSFVVLFNEQKLRDLLFNIDGMQNGAVYIINANNEVLMSSTEDIKGIRTIIESMPSAIYKNNNYLEYTDNGNEMMATYITSPQNGWTYISVVSQSIILSQVDTVKGWALVIIILSLLVGSFVCYRMAYQNYRPVHELLNAVIRRESERKWNENEYDLIRETVSDLFSKEKDMEETLSKQLPVIQADFLSRLIRGHVDVKTLSLEDLDFMGIHFPYPCFAVIIMDIDDCTRFIRQDNEREWALIRFILINVSKELLREHAYMLELERNRIVLLINQPDSSIKQNPFEQMQAFTNELIRIMDQRFKVKVTIANSNIHMGLHQVGECYSEAIIAMEYKMIKGPGSSLHYEDVRNLNQYFYNYPMEMESQLMNYIRNGDFVHAEKHLNQIYEANFHNGKNGMTPEMGRCLYYDMLSTLYKLSNSMNSGLGVWFEKGTDPAKEISDCTTAEEMHNQMKQYYEKICLAIKKEQTGHSELLYRKIDKYMQQHYQESSLSLTSMADYFELNPSYLSTFYKNYSGLNITDYIVNIRIQETKRLLTTTKLNITEIATSVGYASNIGLARVFKKVEGITPGQYRGNHGHSQET
ncbi:MAG: AraC family transcriptional regulator [Bacilli bacterium]